MKNKVFVISLFFILPLFTWAQYTTVTTDTIGSCFPFSPANSIVRNWQGHNDIAVTYSVAPTGEKIFCAINYNDYISGAASPSFPVNSVFIPDSLTGISDFRIIGDYVCFCGHNV